jgi:CheY-like chemotaxis protein
MDLFAAFMTKPVKASYLLDRFMEVLAPTAFKARALERSDAGRDGFDATMGSRHPLRLLLAEDNTINQKVALSVLEHLGYTADVANNGAEAVAAIERQSYDVILMDVQMPEMDGIEATRRIRAALPAAMQPRIIAITANAMQGDRDECFAAGMDDYISKPFRPEDLISALKKCRPLTVGMFTNGSQIPEPPTNLDLSDAISSEAVETAEFPVFDPAGLEQLKEILGQKAGELLPSLLDNFFDDAPKLIANARQALEQEAVTDLRRAAHTLKSNSRDFGAMALAEAARKLEAESKAGMPQNAAAMIERMEEEFAKAKPSLEDARGRMLHGNA